jgi:transposase-like protein
MTTTRKQYSAKFKSRVAIEAIRGEKTLSQLGSQFKVHPIQIAKWRKTALDQLPEVFVDGRTRKGGKGEMDSEALYAEIGRLKVELDWLKKKWACWIEADATAGGAGPPGDQHAAAMRVVSRTIRPRSNPRSRIRSRSRA